MATKTAEAHLVQYIDRVVDVPVDEGPGDAEHAGSCCAKRHSDEKAFIDILPECVATIAVQTQTTENLADESLYFSGEAASGSHMMTQEVMVPVAGLPRVLGHSVRETPWCTLRKDSVPGSYEAHDGATGSRGDPEGDSSLTVVLEVDERSN